MAAAGVRFGTVLADAGDAMSAAFRHGLEARELQWAVGIARNQKVYGMAVKLVRPVGRARKPVPSEAPRPAEDVLAELLWRRVTWRHGAKGPLAARFAAVRVRVRVGDGPAWGSRAAERIDQHLPGKDAWLVGE